MSRTRKGQKPPGWENWGNIREKERLKADYFETEEESEAYGNWYKEQRKLDAEQDNLEAD